MNNIIHPCLWFDGNAKAAADFYCSLFKNSKITTDTPMVVMFELNGKKIMGLNGGPMFKINPSISLFVLCETIKDTNELWSKLIDGGKALIAIDKQPWSERYGWVQDKFGMTWQVSVVNKEGDKQQITPSMLFTGNQFGRAEEALKLYASVFGPSSADAQIHYYPEGDANAGKVMYSEFKLNDYPMIAMDGPGEHAYTFNEGVSLVVNCETQKEIDHFWDKLTANGGQESMCGWLKDKFGVSWQIVPSIIGKLMSDKEKAPRVMAAVMNMKKLDIETMVNA
ncbi:MAG TPA: VOC family protein [Chitinophagaceae bacterium]|nr:VOC family protein [Chitinophagaceae bacterium]